MGRLDNFVDDLYEERKEIKNLQQFAAKFKLMTPEEEREKTIEQYQLRLFVLMSAWAFSGDLKLPHYYPLLLSDIVKRFIKASEYVEFRNYRLVLKSCQLPSYTGRGLSMFDLAMEGLDGLRYASRVKYNPYKVDEKTGKPIKFATYATYWIKQRIGRAIEKKGSSVKIAGHIQSIMSKIRRVTQKYIATNNNQKPTAEIIVTLLHQHYPDNPSLKDITPEKVAEYGRLDWQVVSLNEEISTDEGSLTMMDYLEGPDGYQPEVEYEDIERKEQIQKLLEHLDDDEKVIISYSFGLLDTIPRSPKYISKILNIPIKECKKKQESAMAKLKANADSGLAEYY